MEKCPHRERLTCPWLELDRTESRLSIRSFTTLYPPHDIPLDSVFVTKGDRSPLVGGGGHSAAAET